MNRQMNPVGTQAFAGRLLLTCLLTLGTAGLSLQAASREPPKQPTNPALSQDVVESNGQGVLLGTVSIGPICSVPTPGKVCTPRPGAFKNILVHITPTGSGHGISAKPDAQGQYRLTLPAGTYQVAVFKNEHMTGPSDLRTVTIRPGQAIHLQSELDAGLR